MKKRTSGLLAIFILSLLFVQNSVSVPKKQEEPFLTEITVIPSENHLLLFAVLQNGFTEGMIQGLHSGMPIHFTFSVELTSQTKGSRPETAISMQTNHIITYDTLKENYLVEIEESGKRFFTFDTLTEAQKSVNEINGLKVAELKNIQHAVPYTVKIRAALYKRTLPKGLRQIVPFVTWWDIKTKWQSLTFKL